MLRLRIIPIKNVSMSLNSQFLHVKLLTEENVKTFVFCQDVQKAYLNTWQQ